MRTLAVVALAATMLSLPAVAEDGGAGTFVGQEVDVSFAASKARLKAEGYRGVKQVDGDALYLSAFDPQGSEVLLTISPQTGEIDTTDYVHPMDE